MLDGNTAVFGYDAYFNGNPLDWQTLLRKTISGVDDQNGLAIPSDVSLSIYLLDKSSTFAVHDLSFTTNTTVHIEFMKDGVIYSELSTSVCCDHFK